MIEEIEIKLKGDIKVFNENKFGSKEICDLLIYDENGNFVVKLDTLKNAKLSTEVCEGTLIVKDALMNIDFLKFMNNSESDFENCNGKNLSQNIIFNADSRFPMDCKLIAITYLRNMDGYDYKCVYKIPKAIIKNKFMSNMSAGGDPDTFDITFTIKPYNENNDLFEMKIEDNTDIQRLENKISSLVATINKLESEMNSGVFIEKTLYKLCEKLKQVGRV